MEKVKILIGSCREIMPGMTFLIPNEDMKKILSAFFLLSAWTVIPASAQDILEHLRRNTPGQGTVTISQEENITALLSADLITARKNYADSGAEKDVLKKQGYRVQVYVGNNTRDSKNEANKIAEEMRNKFPELSVYATFNPPRWLCRVGDFLTIEEADAAMREIKQKGSLKEISIVKDQIILPIK